MDDLAGGTPIFGNTHITSKKALLKMIFFFFQVGYVSSLDFRHLDPGNGKTSPTGWQRFHWLGPMDGRGAYGCAHLSLRARWPGKNAGLSVCYMFL